MEKKEAKSSKSIDIPHEQILRDIRNNEPERLWGLTPEAKAEAKTRYRKLQKAKGLVGLAIIGIVVFIWIIVSVIF